MKFTMPILAAVVALLFIASQSVYTVDQRKYAVKFQLGEVVETKTTAGLYFKMPLDGGRSREALRSREGR